MRPLIVQISRGMAPAKCIAEAAVWGGTDYRLVAGMTAPAAKNEAVRLALESRRSLLLVEDDVLATADQWMTALYEHPDAVVMASAICRNGTINTVRDDEGGVLYSGSSFLRIPLPVLQAMTAQFWLLFAPWDFITDNGELQGVGPNGSGYGSDVYFWWRLKQLKPPAEVIEVGMVTEIAHPYNSDTDWRYSMANPHELKPRELKR